MIIREVIDALDSFAPLPLQESWDNAGLQVGTTVTQAVTGVLLCLDVTENVVQEAIDEGCNVIVSHHPLLFHKLGRVSEETYVERCVRLAVKNDITILSWHTNLDAVIGYRGVELDEELGCAEFLDRLKADLKADCILTNMDCNNSDFKIKKVVFSSGAGAFKLEEAIGLGADAFVTGEMKYNDYFDRPILIAVVGHYESERWMTKELMRVLENLDCKIIDSKINTNPIKFWR